MESPTLFDLEDVPKKKAKKAKAAKSAPSKTKTAAKGKPAAAKGPKSAAPAKKAAKKAAKPRAEADGDDEPERPARSSGGGGGARDISVAEFFEKNRHMLGFDSPTKAILMSVKEAVDNSLDACEEADILPEISIVLTPTGTKTYRMAVEDNGPGITQDQIGKIFGKLLYGSKFHRLSQSRGQQGIGISAAGMYGKLTTGKPVYVRSKMKRKPAFELTLSLDTARNKPEIHTENEVEWDKPHGTLVEIEMEAQYKKGLRSVDMYLKQTAIANPHLTLHFDDGNGEAITYERNTKVRPDKTIEIKPHPHGVELGRLISMLKDTSCRSLSGFLQEEFSRVGPTVAKKIIKAAGQGLTEKSYPSRCARDEAAALYEAIETTKISSPPTDCIAPIGPELLLSSLKKEVEADFYVTSQRPAAVYRGNPFQIEVGLAYGKPGGVGLEMTDQGRIRKTKAEQVVQDLVAAADEPARVMRIANRVPLLYQQAGCAITKSIIQTNWRGYGLTQPRGALPVAPMVIMVHIASVWVPFTSESKEALASYPEILKEVKLGLQECGRKLGTYIRKGKRLKNEFAKREYIEMYIPHVGAALQDILGLTEKEKDNTIDTLKDVLNKSRKF